MLRRTFRLGWVVAVLALATLACTCGLVQGLTQAGEGLQTVQAVATQVTTLQAAATQIATSGVLETVQAVATQAATTGALETLQAVGTDVGVGERPEDIPVMEDPKDLFTTKELVSYTVSANFDDVVKFYRDEMAANGWEETNDSFVSTGFATLTFKKTDREASAVISGDGGVVSIIIAISNTGQ